MSQDAAATGLIGLLKGLKGAVKEELDTIHLEEDGMVKT